MVRHLVPGGLAMRRRNRDEAARAKAAELLSRMKPLHRWLAEAPRSPQDLEMREFVQAGLERLAEGGEVREVTITKGRTRAS